MKPGNVSENICRVCNTVLVAPADDSPGKDDPNAYVVLAWLDCTAEEGAEGDEALTVEKLREKDRLADGGTLGISVSVLTVSVVCRMTMLGEEADGTAVAPSVEDGEPLVLSLLNKVDVVLSISKYGVRVSLFSKDTLVKLLISETLVIVMVLFFSGRLEAVVLSLSEYVIVISTLSEDTVVKLFLSETLEIVIVLSLSGKLELVVSTLSEDTVVNLCLSETLEIVILLSLSSRLEVVGLSLSGRLEVEVLSLSDKL